MPNSPCLERLLMRALEVASPLAGSPPLPAPPSEPTRERPRWWLSAASVAGLALSALLLARLAPRIGSAGPPMKVAQVPAASISTEPVRQLPPAPVSFPTPPRIEAAPSAVEHGEMPSLGTRPAGELSRPVMLGWRDAFVAMSTAWPAMEAQARASALASLASWMAAGGAADLGSLRALANEALAGMEPRARMLGEALDAMLLSQVAASPRLSSEVAADPAVVSASGIDAPHALERWASRQVAALAGGMDAPDARGRWSGWLQAVGAIDAPEARSALALGAIGAILRGNAHLDGQGIAADALGSLLAGVPSHPEQPGFAAVRDALAAWLRDPSIPSARLWALGGIWRAGSDPPDAWLLPGERDGPQARAALAGRWSQLSAAAPTPVWKPLLEQLGRVAPRPAEARLEARLDDLASRLRLLRRAESSEAPPAEALVEPDAAIGPTPAPESRWARQLSEVAADTRQRALREMRAEAPEALAPADAAALAARALGAASRDERTLAQEVVHGSLAANAAMREALAHEVALCADPRLSVEFLERLLRRELPADEAASLRVAALVGLLGSLPPSADTRAAAGAMRRVHGEARAWAAAAGLADLDDASAIAWSMATRACAEAPTLRPPPETQPLVRGIVDRVRRLSRIAPDGPRGFAAALAVLCDARAARLSVQRANLADQLRRIADAASTARARASDALQQAAISLDALATMHLLVAGAPVTVPPAESHAGQQADRQARATALGELDRADAMLAEGAGDRRLVNGALRHATSLDVTLAGRVALALAQAESEPARRATLLEAATMLGEGATLPPADRADLADGLALAQLLAWSERGQGDRLVAARMPERVRSALAAFAAASGSSIDECLACLRQSGSPQRARLCERLRSAALHAIDPASGGWLGAISAGQAAALPEGDAAQPWRFSFPRG